MDRIDNPKIFLSYAWGTQEYQNKVLAFANSLMENGIDVIFDKWSLKEGHDTYAFMEKSVTDKSVTNVLILLDPLYAEKANSRSGGVGTETQIISPEIYGKVDQEKIIPVIFERDKSGKICKPSYLNSLLHFDLTDEKCYLDEFQRLVRRLFGIEILKKPTKGNPPIWLETNSTIPLLSKIKYDNLKSSEPYEVKKFHFIDYLNEIKKSILEFDTEDIAVNGSSLNNYLDKYLQTIAIRDNYLELIKLYPYINNAFDFITDFLEDLSTEFNRLNGNFTSIKKIFLHEIFIYTIALLVKVKDYCSIGKILGKTYFINNEAKSFKIFYTTVFELLDKAMCNRDDKNYYCGTAHLWKNNINESFCSKDNFILADILCYNYSVFKNDNDVWPYWFPIMYIYKSNIIQPMAIRLQSKEYLLKVLPLFNFKCIEDFKTRFIKVEENLKTDRTYQCRYSMAFETAPLLCYYISSQDLGIVD